MPSEFRAPRGTRDILPADRAVWSRVEAAAREIAARYGYREIETPLFEQSAVFERGVGEVTDIVEKELFRVSPSRGEERERWALRPEATAGIVRAYLEHGLHTLPQPLRLNLYGPMFRYDRPQAGRYRQFWQWDVEAIGDPGPAIDAEIIELGLRFYRSVGLTTVEAKLNSIGDSACRPAYVELLRSYYAEHRDLLPETERRRLETNPLRLLDSKEAVLAELNARAPKLADHLCGACADHFAAVRAHLDALGVPYRISPEIVRGLDYYTRTTFEYFKPGAEGQQDALGGGGRYDGLIELLGGRPTPAIGYALGIDRVVSAVQELGEAEAGRAEGASLTVVVGADPIDTAGRLRLATDLRAAGLTARADLSTRRLGKQLEAAARDGAHFAVILGDEALGPDGSGDRGSGDRASGDRGSASGGHVQLRDLPAGTQRSVSLSDLVRELERANQTHHHG